eukprot:4401168-Alexandrium_andersonii.AAC.1
MVLPPSFTLWLMGTDGTLWPTLPYVDAAWASLMSRRGTQEGWRGAQHMASAFTCDSPAPRRAAPRKAHRCVVLEIAHKACLSALSAVLTECG